jgi:hypothetical protein
MRVGRDKKGAPGPVAGSAPPRDRRTALRFLRTLPRALGPTDGARHTRAAWRDMPVHLQQRIATLATAAGCADELRRIVEGPAENI